ncbi:MAG: glycosyltransferase, partial [Chloroflexi bacterium]|nr:glycosyltransferase [Chloroflexota bacterium]
MRIAINAWFWNSPTAGSGQYTRRLVEHLVALEPGLEILLVAPKGWRCHVSRFTPPVSRDTQPETLNLKLETGSLRKTCFEQIAFPRACRRLGADVAHVPYWAPPLRSSVPTVVTIHDLIPLLLPEYQGGPLVRFYTALVSRAALRAALVLTDSEASKRDIVAHLGLPGERVRTVYLAASERYTPMSLSSLPGGSRRGVPERYVLYLGGFDVRKNVATVLKAYRRAQPV